ncbi:MAG: molybdopterin-synthase adenylyltransferase MoeB [Cellvibrionaceae bacterium]|nr:molybdopterin-synthase adenylyltransferase MoeB [Cellvibrionaceae bacterium]
MAKTTFSDAELLRYSRHILLPQLDINGQLAIANAKVLVVGVGGLGSAAVQYLAAAGVGRLLLADHDTVELSNLQRQVIHNEQSLGLTKVESAARAIGLLNPEVKVEAIAALLQEPELDALVAQVDVVLDCCDNFETRKAVNQACVNHGKPLVSGAAIRLEGQLTVFDVRHPDSPCYQCLYDVSGGETMTCAQSGVLSPLVGVIGTSQALEALKLIAGFGEALVGRLQLYDAAYGSWRELKLRRDPECGVCRGRAAPCGEH